jgi:hypothetical protein
MAKGDEKLLSTIVYDEIKKSLEKDFPNFKIEEKIKVLSELTCIIDKEEYKLGLGFAEVDIAIFKKIEFDKKNKEIKKYFKFIQSAQKETSSLNIPYVIIELKSGKTTSDAIRARSIVASRIKKIFPFSTYIFIGENTYKKNETLLRQGKDFDNYFVFQEKIQDENIAEIYEKFIKTFIQNITDIIDSI